MHLPSFRCAPPVRLAVRPRGRSARTCVARPLAPASATATARPGAAAAARAGRPGPGAASWRPAGGGLPRTRAVPLRRPALRLFLRPLPLLRLPRADLGDPLGDRHLEALRRL